jgi:hypothetical protein
MMLNDIKFDLFLQEISSLRPNLNEFSNPDIRSQFIKEFSGARREEKIKSMIDAAYFSSNELNRINKHISKKYLLYLTKKYFSVFISFAKGIIILSLILFFGLFIWYSFFTERVQLISKENAFIVSNAATSNAPYDFLDDQSGYIKKSADSGMVVLEQADFLKWLKNSASFYYVKDNNIIEGEQLRQYKEYFGPLKGTAEYDSLRSDDKRVIFHFLDSINKIAKYSISYEQPPNNTDKNFLAFDHPSNGQRVLYIKLDNLLGSESNVALLQYSINNPEQYTFVQARHILDQKNLGTFKFFYIQSMNPTLIQIILIDNANKKFQNTSSDSLGTFIDIFEGL